jgi:hypothetical protein
VIETNTFENIHRKIISQLTTMAHWKIKGHTEVLRVREFDRQTNTLNDREDGTIPKQINNRGIRTHIKQLIQNEGDIVNVMGDGHCMYRAIGNILQKQPGEMMQEVRAHMLSMNSCNEFYLVDREVTKRESRYTAMMNSRHNKRGLKIHETEWGEPEDCVAIAKWSRRDVIILHTVTDRCTIIPYMPNAIETKTVAKLLALDWTREPSRGKHGIYLIHDGIHYNAIRLRNNEEER